MDGQPLDGTRVDASGIRIGTVGESMEHAGACESVTPILDQFLDGIRMAPPDPEVVELNAFRSRATAVPGKIPEAGFESAE